ncbi:MAG: hypothetical protein P1U68_05880 [Verrucomicrobiales bacterium]|nr:hypothetical protein [Verrucomicrobiales bacterium]
MPTRFPLDSTVTSRLNELRETLSPRELQRLAMQRLHESWAEAKECPTESNSTESTSGSRDESVIEPIIEHKHRSLTELAPPAPVSKFYPKSPRPLKSPSRSGTELQTYPPEPQPKNCTIGRDIIDQPGSKTSSFFGRKRGTKSRKSSFLTFLRDFQLADNK